MDELAESVADAVVEAEGPSVASYDVEEALGSVTIFEVAVGPLMLGDVGGKEGVASALREVGEAVVAVELG